MLVVPSVAFAQNPAPSVQPPTSSTISNDVNARADRIKDRKARAQRQFSFIEQRLIKQKCPDAQTKIVDLSKVVNFVQKRTQGHEKLVAKLTELSAKLKSSGIDTKEYDEQVSVLKQKVSEYTAELAASQQTFSDLKLMQCATDPEGFATTLLEARKLRLSFVEKGKEIRLYLKETIKPTLKEIRSQLKTNNKSLEKTQ